MQGILKNLGENFGFFHTDQGDVFVHRSNLRYTDPKNGDRCQFRTVRSDKKRPTAEDVEFVARGEPVSDDRSRGGDRPDRSREQKITVALTSVEEGEIRDFPEGKFRVIPVTLLAKKGNGPGPGLSVQFFLDGQSVDQIFTTDASGHTYYDAHVAPEATRAFIVAVVKDGDRDVGVYSHEWKKKKDPPKDDKCRKVEAFKSAPNAESFTPFRIVTTNGDREGISEEIGVWTEAPVDVLWNSQAHTGSIVTDKGHAVVDVRTKDSKVGGLIAFYSIKTPTLSSEPQMLSPWEPKTKKCKKIKTTDTQGRPGFKNALLIESLEDVADNSAKIPAKLVVEFIDEIVVEIDGTEQRGRRIEFDTDVSGEKLVKIFFVRPHHYGQIKIVSYSDRSVSVTIFVRHPQSAMKPA
jgi:cold shock CspA family protein